LRAIILSILCCLTALLSLAAQPGGKGAASCPVVKIEAERLPDLNVPRSGHSILLVNGEPTVIGGHTTNFVPTATIEYYKDGKWNLVPSAFTHDDGFAVALSSGKVLIGGGHERNLGIGQSFEVELYDPLSRTCEGFSSLDTKRAMASAIALDGNQALITGNWYHDDAIELYDGKDGFMPIKGTSCERAIPYILRTAKDNAIIFAAFDTKGNHTPHPIIDRLHGEAYREPLLDEWGFRARHAINPTEAFIGDETKGDYSYLLAVENEQGQMAIARVTNGQFSLLPTDFPVPMTCRWGKIFYSPTIYVDQKSRRAYLVGTDPGRLGLTPIDSARVYVLTIDYAVTPARLTLGYTDVLNDFDIDFFLMTSDGDVMITGGLPTQNNFKPSSATWLLHVNSHAQKAAMGSGVRQLPSWGWALIVLAIAALATWLILRTRVRPRLGVPANQEPAVAPEEECQENTHEQEVTQENTQDQVESQDQVDPTEGSEDNAELMQRICQLMEEQQLYLNPNLKLTDIATLLGTNRGIISNCINTQRDCTFPQFVNFYRVQHAQQLLSSQSDTKLTEVWTAAGFSSESSFYRIFKSITGSTPSDWRSNVSP